MLNFDFYNPTQIVFGKDRIADLCTLFTIGTGNELTNILMSHDQS